MKFPVLLLGITLVCCLGIAGYIHNRRKQEINLNKQVSFLDIKFRVTRDVLGEYQDELTQATSVLEKTQKEMDALTKEVSEVKGLLAKKKNVVDTCKGDKKRILHKIAETRSEKPSVQTEFAKEKSRWAVEVASLTKELNEQSRLCQHIDKTSKEARKLCGIPEELPKPVEKPRTKQPKPEEPKHMEPEAQQPKPQEPKHEVPKAEQPKPQEPKREEPKAKQPKPQDPKREEPKAEQPKPQEPKPEQPKAEQPKPQDPKREEPKAKQPKPQDPKREEPKAEQPKPQEPKPEQPKAEQPKPQEPKHEEPMAEQLKPVKAKAEDPKVVVL